MYPKLSTMWGTYNITEVRKKHVVTFFYIHCGSVNPSIYCSFSCTQWSYGVPCACFEMRALECSCPVLTRKVIMMMMLEAWGFFFCLFLFLFQPPIWTELYWREWGCSKRKDKKANSQRGALIWLYYWLTECQTMVSYFVESNCFTLRGLSCLHIKQV